MSSDFDSVKKWSFRAYVNTTTGAWAIDEWDASDRRFKPNGKTYFHTYEEAHARVMEKLAEWLKQHQERIESARKLNTHAKYLKVRNLVIA